MIGAWLAPVAVAGWVMGGSVGVADSAGWFATVPRRVVRIPASFGEAPAERGVGLGLFSQDPEYRYRALLEEIKETGATHVSVVWVWWQQDVHATAIRAVPGWSATDEQIVETLHEAEKLGFRTTAFPIVRLQRSTRSEWRGRIAPRDEDTWWDSYLHFILHAADLAKRGGADRLTVGSELLSRERMRGRWRRVIDQVRLLAPDLELMYSANWDHFAPVSVWDLVDVAGLTAYWELTKSTEADVSDLLGAWRTVKPRVLEFAKQVGRPVVFTEVGYPSLDGAAAWPWDETRKAAIDLEEQRRAYEAFVRTWSGERAITGVYWWNWFGFGGPEDGDYTPRHKPAAEVIRRWFGAAATVWATPGSARPSVAPPGTK